MRWLMVVVASLLALSLLLGCAKPAPPPSPTPAKPAPAAPAPAPKPTVAASPKPAAPASPKPAAPASSAADFFKNNQVTIIVGYAAGGANDYAGRVVANAWQEVFGATATVKNVPTGGGMVATNDVFKAKPDGLTLGVLTFGTQLAVPTLYKQEGMAFDVNKFSYIGMYADEMNVLALGKNKPENSLADMQKLKSLKFGTSSRTGGPATGGALVLHLLGIENSAVVAGYGGVAEVGIAVAKGELDGYVYSAGSTKADVDKGFVKPIATVNLKRTKLFPSVPAVPEAMKLSPENERLLKVYSDIFLSARVLLGPPGLEADKLQFLRTSFDKMVTLKSFQEQAISRYGVFEAPATGKEVEARVKETLAYPAADVAKMKELVKKYVK